MVVETAVFVVSVALVLIYALRADERQRETIVRVLFPVLLLGAAVISGLSLLGVEMESALGAAGILTAVVAITVQDIAGNLLAGVIARMDMQYHAKDFLFVEGVGDCRIERVGGYSTLVELAGTKAYATVSNKQLLDSETINYSRSEWYYILVRVPVAGEFNKSKFVEELEDLLIDLPWASVAAEPKIHVSNWAANAIEYEVSIGVQPTQHASEWHKLARTEIEARLGELYSLGEISYHFLTNLGTVENGR